MLDVPRLRVLRAVVSTGSIRASAAALGYTSSAVSQQLAALQRETGLHLFERVGRGIEPTAAARTLAAETGPLFEALSRVEGVVGDLRAGRVGTLSIGYFGSAGTAWLPSIVAVLRAEFPDLRLDLRITEFEPVEVDIDIVVEAPGTQYSPQAEVHRLVDDPFLVVVREDDQYADRAEVRLPELAERHWVDNDIVNGPCRQALLKTCAETGFSPRFVVEARDYQTAIPFVATGIGITVIPLLGLGILPPGLVAVPLVSPTPIRHINVAVKKSVAQHPAAERTVSMLHDLARTPR